MRKYLEVFRLSFKMQIVWRFDVAMTMVATVARIVAAWVLWQAIFAGKELVGGFTVGAMLSYYVVCSIVSSIDFSHKISGEVCWLIRDGRFSGHMVAPMNPLGFFGSMQAGESAFHLGFSLIAAAICAVAFGMRVALSADILQILLAAAMIPLGLAFMAGYHFWIGTLTFKFLDIDFFLHVQGNVIAFATGALIPLALLPQGLLQVLRLLPFTHVVYTPAMLLTGQMATGEGLFGLGVLAMWTAAMLAIAQRTYGRLRVKYDGVGI
ncbi:MAG: ABC-2 family transporter protein [Clostridia bacterium]|nr:ABC-2 family transporter protein [Clostridia bacterium]